MLYNSWKETEHQNIWHPKLDSNFGYIRCGYIRCGYKRCGYIRCGYIRCGYISPLKLAVCNLQHGITSNIVLEVE